MRGTQIFKILGVLITLLVCVSGSYATNPNEVNTADNVNLQQADQTTTDLGYIADDSNVDDSGADDSGSDDSNADDSGSDDTNPSDIYYALATSEFADGNAPFAAGGEETDDSGADDFDNGSGEVDDNGYDETGIDDGSSDDNGSDDNGTDEYTLTAEQTGVAGNGGNGGRGGDGGNLSANNTLNSTNSIPMQHTGLPILPALLGVLSLVGGFAINKKRS